MKYTALSILLVACTVYGSYQHKGMTHITPHQLCPAAEHIYTKYCDGDASYSCHRLSTFMHKYCKNELDALVGFNPKELCPISNANGRSIGIDLQNYGGVENSYTGSKYTPAQYEAANNLMAYLGNLHNIPIDDKHILAHFEVTKTRKTYSGLNKNDPYPPFDWSKVAGVEYDHQDKNGPKMDALVTG